MLALDPRFRGGDGFEWISDAGGNNRGAAMSSRNMPRRRVLEASLAGAAGFVWRGALPAFAEFAATPEQTAGPFYPLSYPADSDNDLVHVAGRRAPAKGTPTQVAGRILDRTGRPVTGVRVEIWQCDANGRYHHVQDDRNGRPLDDNFQGWGQTVTDAAGGYRFLTIRPVPYPGRTPHIHFAVSGPGRRRFVTQMYIAGEPGNERDGVLTGVRDPAARARINVALEAAADLQPAALAGRFDIVLPESLG
jgi:protocatechuate 3,4-dioxygenase beta subunit